MRQRIFKALFVLIIIFLFTTTFSQQHSTGPDAWENYHNSLQPPEKVMKAIGVKPGMVIGEIGAGRGRYAVRLAAKVGKTGRIYANDILKSKLEYLEHRCKRDGITNIVTILGDITNPKFPIKSLDMVFIINTYHHLEKPTELLKNVVPSLKPDATLVIVEHDPGKVPGHWDSHHATEKEILLKQAEKAGFKPVRIETFLPRDNIYIFRVKNSE